MGLHFKVSNNLNALATDMIAASYKDLGIFQPVLLITQTKGMNNWLTQQIATEKGIAANIQYVQPAQFIINIYNLIADQRHQTISRNNIDWLIYQALSEKEFKNLFPYQYNYFIENGKENEVKKWELAAKTADLFDQYQIYRHQKIQDWNKELLNEKDEKFRWQYYLWNRVKQMSGTLFPDMTEMQIQILKALEIPEKTAIIRKKYPKISLFGISIITPFHIQIIYKLSAFTDFYFYLLNPAPEHLWEYDKNEKDLYYLPKGWEVVVGNSLLTGWGKILQSTSKMLFTDDAIFNLREEIDVQAPSRNSLLNKIQNDIYNNETQDIEFELKDLQDKSIHISSVYAIQGEVEALYNYILKTVSNKELSAFSERDILIIVTDVNKYAPYIKAVFDNAPYRFQYSIADESITKGDTAAGALLALLEIDEHNFTAEQVLSLFDFTCIRNKFGIEDTAFLRDIIHKSFIRFGIDNSNIDDTYLVSWKYGLEKLMYGICFEESLYFQYQNQEWITMDVADGNYPIQQIVRLTAFVTQLIESIQVRKNNHSLNGWKAYINSIATDFIEQSEQETEEDLLSWLQHINQFDKIDELIKNDQISFGVFNTRFKGLIQTETQSGKYLSKGITFCSPLPFRSIPFKMIGILGLQMDAFPRKEKAADFDMIKNSYELGDRNIKENDKHLFLESLLSAKERLYLSYIGKSVKDNGTLPASILIDELLDYIQSGIDINSGIDVRKTLVTQYPLQSYSIRYNRDNNAVLTNYFIQKEKTYPFGFQHTVSLNEGQDDGVISLKNLEKWIENPIRFYYNKALQIYFNEEDDTIEETEVFSVDTLSASIMTSALLQDYLQDPSHMETHLQELYLQGKLPLKNMKEIWWQQAQQSLSAIQGQIKEVDANKFESVNCTVNLESGKKIEGTLHNVNNETLYLFHNSKNLKSKHFIKLYIQYLVGVASGNINKAILINVNEKYIIEGINQDDALERLGQLTSVYNVASQQLLFFSSSYLDAKSLSLGDDFEDKIESITDSEYFYDDFAKLAVEKSQHLGQLNQFTELVNIINRPLDIIKKIN